MKKHVALEAARLINHIQEEALKWLDILKLTNMRIVDP